MSKNIRDRIDGLLSQYESHVGRGKMDNAGVTLKELVHSLVDLVVERTSAYVEPVVEEVTIGTKLAVADAKENLHKLEELVVPTPVPAAPEPCAPCDVSIPNNPALIEDFKKSTITVDIPEAPAEAETVTRNGVTEEVIEHTTQAAPAVVEEAAAEEPAAVVTSPEGDVAPAPRTPRKPKP